MASVPAAIRDGGHDRHASGGEGLLSTAIVVAGLRTVAEPPEPRVWPLILISEEGKLTWHRSPVVSALS
jgi:hypothetical protein